MRFVFLGPELCLQLPPRDPSRDQLEVPSHRGPQGTRTPKSLPARLSPHGYLPPFGGTHHAWRTTEKPIAEIATELGVGCVLEGSVRRAGDRVRIVAQLNRLLQSMPVTPSTMGGA